MTTAPKPLTSQTDAELLDLLAATDKALRTAGDNATGAVAFRWAILAELVLRGSK